MKRERDGVSHDRFDTFVATHHGEIYRYLLLVTGSVVDADDLSQETFLQAFKIRKSFWDVTSVRQELFAIATDLSRRRLRSRRRQVPGATEQERQHPAAMAMTHLPAEQRIALALRKIYDFDYEGVGRMLGCSSEKARSRVTQAFRKLARMRLVRSALGSVVTPVTPGVPASAASPGTT
jgi:RNA polymerase sigma-70 factor (ECF subfamily)